MKRVIVIGDVHGCIEELHALVDALALRQGDRVVCLGDFMDKGPEPAACVRFARQQGFESVLGNHDARHLRWRTHERARLRTGKRNPMRAMSDEDRAANEALDDDDVAWLQALPAMTELQPGWLAVHGGLLPGLPVEQQDPKQVLRVRQVDGAGQQVALDYENPAKLKAAMQRSSHWATRWQGPQSVVYGHEAFSLHTPRVDQHATHACWGIDTGAVYGGHLSALVLPELSLVQAKAQRRYSQPLLPIEG